ncbi:MAG: ribokinase [Verrucomicrobiaceae bacterium]|nr:ribokinase [Verrucomicrobiaceae bacterium]
MRPPIGERIVVVGSHAPAIMVYSDRIPTKGETVMASSYAEPQDGGKGSLQAIAAARLGGNVVFLGCVGRDRLGESGLEMLSTEGVDVSRVKQSAELPTGAGFVIIDHFGEPAILTAIGANALVNDSYIAKNQDRIREAKVLLTQLETNLSGVLSALLLARSAKVISILNPAPVPSDRRVMHRIVSKADILTPNAIEAAELVQSTVANVLSDPAAAATEIQKRFCVESVVLTLGSSGAVVASDGHILKLDGWSVPAVDATGAGDAFSGALAHGLSKGWKLADAAEFANCVAAASVTLHGTVCSMPFARELKDIFSRLKISISSPLIC